MIEIRVVINEYQGYFISLTRKTDKKNKYILICSTGRAGDLVTNGK